MYRILIVDDEPIIVDGLYEEIINIENNELDVYKAYSSKVAWDMLYNNRFDILITDIKMPKMNGIQLFDKLREVNSECKVIFLTGYNNFDYVYKAIQYKDVKYILKTEGYDKIIDSVNNFIIQIKDEIKQQNLIELSKKYTQLNKNLNFRDFITSTNGMLDTTQIENQLDLYNIDFDINLDVVVLIGRIDSDYKAYHSDQMQTYYSLDLILGKLFNDKINNLGMYYESNLFVWILQPNRSMIKQYSESRVLWNNFYKLIKNDLELIQRTCKLSLNTTISFSLSKNKIKWTSIHKEILILKQFLYFFISSNESVVIETNNLKSKIINMYDNDNNYSTTKIEYYLLRRNINGAYEFVNTIFNKSQEQISNNRFKAHEIFISLSNQLLKYINEYHLVERLMTEIDLNKLTSLDKHSSWEEARSYINILINKIIILQNHNENSVNNDLVTELKNYINDNIDKNLTLLKLSEIVNFNPSYLSRLFKKVAGININQYITRVRIIKAKELLENDNKKIYEIAKEVGYFSSTNFIRFFRKEMNMTPQEYREYYFKNIS